MKFDYKLVALFLLISINFGQAFDDLELKCKPGHRVARFYRLGKPGNANVTRMAIECKPFTPNAANIKNVECQEMKPITCNGRMQGCIEDNSWMGGMKQFQVDPDSPSDIFVPICCTASNVQIEWTSCDERRLNSYGTSTDYNLESNRLIDMIACWTLKDTKQKIRDEIIKVNHCEYKVDGKTLTADKSKKTAQETTLRALRLLPIGNSSTHIVNKTTSISDSDKPVDKELTGPANTCPPCTCQCPSLTCPENKRALRKVFRRKRGNCVCHCFCDYQCEE